MPTNAARSPAVHLPAARHFVPALAGFLLLAASGALACTNLVCSPGATVDGSVFVTYTCDGEFHPTLERLPAGDHEPGAMQEIRNWSGQVVGQVPYPAHTWAVVNLQNERQVSIAETTTGGRDELTNPDGLLHYWHLMRLALQRAATARECVEEMGRLVAAHGYRSTGESFCIGDPREAWVMEMVGPGPGGNGRPLGGHPRARRLHQRLRQRRPHHDVPEERPEELPLLAGHRGVRRRARLVEAGRRCPSTGARAFHPADRPAEALHRHARLEPVPARGALAGAEPRLPPRRAPAPSPTRCSSGPTAS